MPIATVSEESRLCRCGKALTRRRVDGVPCRPACLERLGLLVPELTGDELARRLAEERTNRAK